jgi:4-hydroxy-3-methylbut-2-en-1-yl diphosphate reductase
VTLVVLAPLRIEALALRGLDVRRTGMGTRGVEVRGGDVVAVAGFCGAADPALRAGDVVLADEVRSGSGAKPCRASGLLASGLERRGLTVHVGPVFSAGHVLGPAERARLREEDGVLAVDMESYWLAQAVGDRPVVVLRVVVDEAGRRLLHPATLPAGVRAFRALRRAAATLAEVDPAAPGRSPHSHDNH